MSNDRATLFTAEADNGRLLDVAAQRDGRIGLLLVDGDDVWTARLSREQAAALGVALISANPEQLVHVARRLDQHVAQQLAACLLVPTCEAGLLEQATRGETPQ